MANEARSDQPERRVALFSALTQLKRTVRIRAAQVSFERKYHVIQATNGAMHGQLDFGPMQRKPTA
ncbi:hypothetical protein DLM46_17525 [Paraburkholderia lacunae]|uniref:Uncharacterized protein n=1 Tax=Paraburkholderia lacunae TaxID=2211104 RepID=A0A370N7N0_9BURK|nr:hypothetical protein DLM46_17525 [Paraburkholderia lacunae]